MLAGNPTRNAPSPTLRHPPRRVHRYRVADEVIPIRPRRGGLVHATALTGKRLNTTLCGRPCHGWNVADDPLTCLRCITLSAEKKPARQDPSGHWKTKVGKLADALGWPRPDLYEHWKQWALEVEYETRMSRVLAEMKAWSLLEACFDKQGSEFAS